MGQNRHSPAFFEVQDHQARSVYDIDLITLIGVINRLREGLSMTIIARARGKRFLVYNGAEKVVFDARPEEGGA